MEQLLHSFCLRGFREKGLFKALQKNKESLSRVFDPSNLKDCEMAFGSLLKQLCYHDTASDKIHQDMSMEGVNVANKIGEEGIKSESEQRNRNDSETDDLKMDVEESPIVDPEAQKEDSSDNSDDSSDSDSSSSSSSSNTQSSQGGEDVPKPRLSSSSSAIFAQSTISLKHVHKISVSGIFDEDFIELSDQFSLKVLEYLEGIESRLFAAQLQEEASAACRSM